MAPLIRVTVAVAGLPLTKLVTAVLPWYTV